MVKPVSRHSFARGASISAKIVQAQNSKQYNVFSRYFFSRYFFSRNFFSLGSTGGASG